MKFLKSRNIDRVPALLCDCLLPTQFDLVADIRVPASHVDRISAALVSNQNSIARYLPLHFVKAIGIDSKHVNRTT